MTRRDKAHCTAIVSRTVMIWTVCLLEARGT